MRPKIQFKTEELEVLSKLAGNARECLDIAGELCQAYGNERVNLESTLYGISVIMPNVHGIELDPKYIKKETRKARDHKKRINLPEMSLLGEVDHALRVASFYKNAESLQIGIDCLFKGIYFGNRNSLAHEIINDIGSKQLPSITDEELREKILNEMNPEFSEKALADGTAVYSYNEYNTIINKLQELKLSPLNDWKERIIRLKSLIKIDRENKDYIAFSSEEHDGIVKALEKLEKARLSTIPKQISTVEKKLNVFSKIKK